MTWWNRMQWAVGYFLVATADYNLSWRLNVQRRVSFGRRKAA